MPRWQARQANRLAGQAKKPAAGAPPTDTNEAGADEGARPTQPRVNRTAESAIDDAATRDRPASNPQEPGRPIETGIATYYVPSMKGRLTPSGEPYDARQLTQAHRTLPLDTRVRVANLNNDRNHACACAARNLDRRSWAGR